MKMIKRKTTPTSSIYDFLKCLEEYKNDIAVIDKVGKKWREFTYSNFICDINNLCAKFTSNKISNTNIALLGDNTYEWMVTYLAIILSGNIVVPLDKELSDNELINLISYSESKIVFYSKSFDDLMYKNYENLICVSDFVCFESHIDNLKPPQFISFKGYININKEKISKKFILFSDNLPSVIVFTSGTTGVSKGVMLSMKNIFSVIDKATDYLYGEGPGISVLPLNHTYGLMCALVMMKLRVPIIFNDKIKNFINNVAEFKPNNLVAVPIYIEKMYKTIMKKLNEENKVNLVDSLIKLSNFLLKIGIDVRKQLFKKIRKPFGGNLKLIICGGAPLAAEYIKFFCDIGVTLLHGYGITECAPLISVNPLNKVKYDSVGRILSCCDIRIDAQSSDSEGEILVKGDNVMLGYYKDNQKTAENIQNGWFKTGDVGRIDKDGYLYITGRIKNMILLSNGKNIYPEEIEERIKLHHAVDEAVVYCSSNEVIVLEYYSALGELEDIDSFVEEVNDNLPIYAQIGKVKVRSTPFPKTTTQKIKRDKLSQANCAL